MNRKEVKKVQSQGIFQQNQYLLQCDSSRARPSVVMKETTGVASSFKLMKVSQQLFLDTDQGASSPKEKLARAVVS